jgi:hypothetical protein
MHRSEDNLVRPHEFFDLTREPISAMQTEHRRCADRRITFNAEQTQISLTIQSLAMDLRG